MKVIKAQTAGFCFGVKRAVDQVYDLAAKEKEPVYTYGPIIHNEEVVRDLEDKGVQVSFVGDCNERAADINRAVEEGYLAANVL